MSRTMYEHWGWCSKCRFPIHPSSWAFPELRHYFVCKQCHFLEEVKMSIAAQETNDYNARLCAIEQVELFVRQVQRYQGNDGRLPPHAWGPGNADGDNDTHVCHTCHATYSTSLMTLDPTPVCRFCKSVDDLRKVLGRFTDQEHPEMHRILSLLEAIKRDLDTNVS